jgi:hypothetical protein
MVSILEAIRAEREKFIPKEVREKTTQSVKVAQSHATSQAQKAVNVQAKGIFDILPKPADLLLFNRDPRQEKAFNEIGVKPQQRVADKTKTSAKNQVSTIQGFLKQNKSIADVFKSFGF